MIPCSILLVEDNLDDIFLSRRTLRKAGIDQIAVASDGLEAQELLFNPVLPLPELLILDLRLPIIHGLTLLTELRRQKRTMTLPIVILSSSNDPKDREACLKLGVVAFLSKPLELSALQQALCDL